MSNNVKSFISIIMFVCCVGVSPKGEYLYTLIVIWINYMYDLCFMSQNAYVKFYYAIHVPNSLNSHVSSVLILMSLTSLIGRSKSNFTSVFWILTLLYWKRSVLLLLMLLAMKRKSIIKLGKDLSVNLAEGLHLESVATYPSAGGRRVTRGMRVPRKEYARSRHQRLFEENVGKTGKDVIYELFKWKVRELYLRTGKVLAPHTSVPRNGSL